MNNEMRSLLRFTDEDDERLLKEDIVRIKKGERKNQRLFERMIGSLIKIQERKLQKRINKIKKSLNTEEKCRCCTWHGPRKKTKPVVQCGTGNFLLSCPACERIIKNLFIKDLWGA